MNTTLENLLSEENISLPENSDRQDKVKALLKVYLENRLPDRQTEKFIAENPETTASKIILSTLIDVTPCSLDTEEDAVKVLQSLKQLAPRVDSNHSSSSQEHEQDVFVSAIRPITFIKVYSVSATESGSVKFSKADFLDWALSNYPEKVDLDKEAIKDQLIEDGIIEEDDEISDEAELRVLFNDYVSRPLREFVEWVSDANALMEEYILEDYYDFYDADETFDEREELISEDDFEPDPEGLSINSTDLEINGLMGF